MEETFSNEKYKFTHEKMEMDQRERDNFINKEESILFSAFIPLEDSSINSNDVLALPQSGCLKIENLYCTHEVGP